MATFVLVHGTGCGGWVRQKLCPLIRAAGHEVYTPTLTGVSDRSHLLDCGVNLTTHITDVFSLLLYEDLSDVVLVGHSYAGMVITGVAAIVPERLKLLVYLDAYVPAKGLTESGLWPAEMRAAILADEAAGKRLREPPPLDFLGITDPQMAAWVKARVPPIHWLPTLSPCQLEVPRVVHSRAHSFTAQRGQPRPSLHLSPQQREQRAGRYMS